MYVCGWTYAWMDGKMAPLQQVIMEVFGDVKELNLSRQGNTRGLTCNIKTSKCISIFTQDKTSQGI